MEETKQCQNCKTDFIIEADDFSFYEKMKVPVPTFCPSCRAERRFVWRNERKLFKVKDAITGDEIFSLYPVGENRKIITRDEWNNDTWDGLDYARDYDYSRTFFEQMNELEKEVPVSSLTVQVMVNSPYCANATGLKNCYLCFNSTESEDCMYGNANDFDKDCIDNSHVNHSERCYECFWLQNCYKCYFTIMSVESSNLWFCRDCLSCNDCIGCVNLRKSSYCIFNKQYTKEEYKEKVNEMKLNTISGVLSTREKSREFWKTQPIKYHQGLKNIDSTGSYITNSKNVNDSFLIREGENMRYCQYLQIPKNKDCYDATSFGANMELNYETCICGGNSYYMKFSYNCWPSCKNIEYGINLVNCSDCFGCVGLRKKQYCILNKQYTKEEYFEKVEEIKKHMNSMPFIDKQGSVYKYGEFFPIEFSPFGYNNTFVNQYFNLTKEEAIQKGYPWIEIEKGQYFITKKTSELLEDINITDESILKETIECENCKSPYRILEKEFLFYKKESIPIPRRCNECRFKRRISDRLKLQLYKRKCMCNGVSDITEIYQNTIKHTHGDTPCGEEFKTGYSDESNEIVYCEKCYQQEVI